MKMRIRPSHALSMTLLLLFTMHQALNQVSATPIIRMGVHASTRATPELIFPLRIRGGASGTTPTKSSPDSPQSTKRKKKKKKKKPSTDTSSSSTTTNPIEGKTAVNTAMKNVDSAEALGNAIRERSSILLNDDGTPNQSDDIPDEIDSTLASLSFSLGSSSPPTATATHHDSGGIEPSRSSILSNYLFQSHGGAYAFQSLCSLFAVSSGVAAFLLPRHKSALLKRTFQCALAKHGAGMLVASVLAAKQIPALGLARTRGKIKTLSATSPLSQYIFYCCLLLVWMPKDVSNKFYARGNVLSGCLLAPVMLREVVHLGWIFCDVVVILGSEDNLFVKFGRDVLNAAMSLLFGPRSWRDADLYGKQKLLAKFVSRMSLVAEVLVGGIIIMDVLRGLGDVVVGGAVKDGASGNSDGSSVLSVLKSCICARLYIHFLMIRRERIEDLLVKMRGGAKDVPIKVLDTILEPGKAMGLEGSVPTNKKKRTVMNVVGEALGFC